MGITSAIVLFAVIWFMVFFIVLPLRMVTQGEAGDVVPGTHASAPAEPQVKRKAKITTYWAIGLWIVIAGTILSGAITVRDLDWFERMSTPEVSAD
jgi:predicted secreted protein